MYAVIGQPQYNDDSDFLVGIFATRKAAAYRVIKWFLDSGGNDPYFTLYGQEDGDIYPFEITSWHFRKLSCISWGEGEPLPFLRNAQGKIVGRMNFGDYLFYKSRKNERDFKRFGVTDDGKRGEFWIEVPNNGV